MVHIDYYLRLSSFICTDWDFMHMFCKKGKSSSILQRLIGHQGLWLAKYQVLSETVLDNELVCGDLFKIVRASCTDWSFRQLASCGSWWLLCNTPIACHDWSLFGFFLGRLASLIVILWNHSHTLQTVIAYFVTETMYRGSHQAPY